jgi:hypothetical protein
MVAMYSHLLTMMYLDIQRQSVRKKETDANLRDLQILLPEHQIILLSLAVDPQKPTCP